jgi:hypothetical protein
MKTCRKGPRRCDYELQARHDFFSEQKKLLFFLIKIGFKRVIEKIDLYWKRYKLFLANYIYNTIQNLSNWTVFLFILQGTGCSCFVTTYQWLYMLFVTRQKNVETSVSFGQIFRSVTSYRFLWNLDACSTYAVLFIPWHWIKYCRFIK